MFKLLHERGNIKFKVFYTWGKLVIEEKYDPGFGRNIKWDIPLLEGYDFEWVENIAKDPGSHHFKGINNPGLIDSIKNWKADAVLVYGWSYKSHLKVMRFFKRRIPVIFKGDSILNEKQLNFKNVIRKLFLKWVYSYADIAFYAGTRNKAYYKNFGMNEDQLRFTPHAIDNERFSKKSNDQAVTSSKWRASLEINRDDIVFLYAGKLDENKNTKMLANAFVEIDKSHTHLLIVGNGSCEASLKKSFGNHPGIHFLPFQNQSQMPELYAMADVFVLPSISETWGLSINEAMASGKAVLVSDSCGAAIDLVKNGINGYTFSSGNIKDLKEKLLKLLEPYSDLKEMGRKSLEIIKDWNYQKDCIAIESLFN